MPPAPPPNAPTPTSLSKAEQDAVLASAAEWRNAGFLVHPCMIGGGKNPVSVEGGSDLIEPELIPSKWPNGKPRQGAGQPNPRAGQYGYGYKRLRDGQIPPLTEAEFAAVIRSGQSDGFGVFAGTPSRGLEMVELEGRAMHLLPKVIAEAEKLGCRDLLERLQEGCVQQSGSGGRHFFLRVSDAPAERSQKLARSHDKQLLSETLSTGKWVVLAPSGGRTHKSGRPYARLTGGPTTVPSFTAAERDLLYQCFRSISEVATRPAAKTHPAIHRRPDSGQGAGESPQPLSPPRRRERLPAGAPITARDDFDDRVPWDELLPDWEQVGEPRTFTRRDGTTVSGQALRRPGTENLQSATLTDDALYVFSTSTVFPHERWLRKHEVYGYLHHLRDDGTIDWAPLNNALSEKGYGTAEFGDETHAPGDIEPARRFDAKDCKSIDGWREEQAKAVESAVDKGGIYLLNGPTGCGKTTAVDRALQKAKSAAIVLPTHENILETVDRWERDSKTLVPYPKLSEDNCPRFKDASKAQLHGLSVGQAVCMGCQFSATCGYQAAIKKAKNAPFRAMTHERYRRNPETALRRKPREKYAYVAVLHIDESLPDVLTPELIATISEMEAVVSLFRSVRDRWESGPSPRLTELARRGLEVHGVILAATSQCPEAGAIKLSWEPSEPLPKYWAADVLEWINRFGVDADMTNDWVRGKFQNAMRLLTGVADGTLSLSALLTDETPQGIDGVQAFQQRVLAIGKPQLPLCRTTLLTDGTSDLDGLVELTGFDIENATPRGWLPPQRSVTQVRFDVTKRQSPTVLRRILKDFLLRNDDVQRLGVIGHREQIQAVLGDGGSLEPRFRSRVAKYCYFGEGPDRASNEWHERCDCLLVVGTPRPNGGSVRARLVRQGHLEAAQRPHGDHGDIWWAGYDSHGVAVTVAGVAYRDPDWRWASDQIQRTATVQALGRARVVTGQGIPAFLYSELPTGLPGVVIQGHAVAMEGEQHAAEVVEAIVSGCLEEEAKRNGTPPLALRISYKQPGGSVALFCAEREAVITLLAGNRSSTKKAAAKLVSRAEKAGLIHRPTKGFIALGRPNPVVGQPVPAAVLETFSAMKSLGEQPLRRKELAREIAKQFGTELRAAQLRVTNALKHEVLVVGADKVVRPGPAAPHSQLSLWEPEPFIAPTTLPPEPKAATTRGGRRTAKEPAQLAAEAAYVDRSLEIDERAAIMEVDGGLAIAVALERAEVATLAAGEPLDLLTPEGAKLQALFHPLVASAAACFAARVLEVCLPPTSARTPIQAAKSTTGCRKCGCESVIEVAIHEGLSTRLDCEKCNAHVRFSRWYAAPPDEETLNAMSPAATLPLIALASG